MLALSRDARQMQRRLFAVQPSSGTVDPLTSIRIAQLMNSSKRRMNGNLTMRMMIFIGSAPTISQDGQQRLLSMAALLAKDRINVDVIAFGSVDETKQTATLLQPFIDALGTGSQLVSINRDQDFNSTIFFGFKSLSGQGRVNLPGMATGESDEADADLMMAIALSIEEANKHPPKEEHKEADNADRDVINLSQHYPGWNPPSASTPSSSPSTPIEKVQFKKSNTPKAVVKVEPKERKHRAKESAKTFSKAATPSSMNSSKTRPSPSGKAFPGKVIIEGESL